MVDLALSAARLLAAFFLVALNGFFVASEFAFVRVRPTAVEQYADSGRFGAETLPEVMANLDDYLATTQLGITIASLGLGWIGEPAVAALLEPVLGAVLPGGSIHFVAFALGFGFITFLHVVFGELAPKTIAIADAERISLFVAPPMKAFYYLLVPGIVVFNGTANAFTRLLGVPPASESEETYEEEELLRVLSQSGEKGHVDTSEVEMIERVFELDDRRVREVMVPRPDVVSVPSDLPLSELRSVILEAQHTRYPVTDAADEDQVVGFVDVKDVLWASEDGDGGGITAGDLAREIHVVPETGRLDELLDQFQRDRSQVAAVIDEWGAFAGIATVENVVEQVVGDIRDEFDVDEREPSIDRREDGTYLVDGGVPISRVNDELGTAFETAEFATVGGLVLDRLGRVPEVGDSVTVDRYRLDVDGVDGARVSSVLIRPEDDATDGADADPDEGADPADEEVVDADADPDETEVVDTDADPDETEEVDADADPDEGADADPDEEADADPETGE
ncbi:cobalt transporter [Halobacteriales archaeon QS_8_69_26]|nr:MAG: cobalt transporter [Halobacteriales archaeon QS_8_69_26]